MYYFIIALGFLLIFIITLLWRQTDSRYIELINKIPGPPTLPVVGNTYEMFGPPEYVWRMFQENNKRYYPIYRLWNAHIASVELLCPEDIEVLLTNNENLEKSRIYEFLQVWLGTGLLTSKDTKWHYRRKLITPAFHFGILKNFSKTMIERSELLIQNLELECNKAKTLIEPIIGEFTLRTICETAMGTKLEENDARSKEYMTSIYNMGQVILERIKRPWLFVECFYYFTQLRKQENALIKILHKFTTDVIENRKVQFKNVDILSASIREKGDEPKRRLALLDLLLHFRNQGASIQDEGIREEVDTFTFEGHDTTSSGIQFALLLLANNPHIQKRVAEEIRNVMGDSDRQFTYADVQNMHYLEMTIKESLRLFPSVPIIARKLTTDLRTASNYLIPKGTVVHVHIFTLHRNPVVFPNPEKFDPERFSPENSRGRHPFAYIPFSAGPRNCIGQRFAMLELKIAIASIIRNFRLIAVDKLSDIQPTMHLVLKNSTKLSIQFRKRTYTNSP